MGSQRASRAVRFVFGTVTLILASAPAGAQFEWQKLVAGDGGPKDWFGTSVSVSGDRALVGAIGDVTSSGGNCAYVIERQANGTWAQVAKLHANSKYVYWFGASVSLSGDRAAVGAPESLFGSISNGSAHVFERQPSGEWIEVAGPYALNDFFSYFGQSVALSGDRLVVGAPGSGKLGLGGGNVRVFERQASGAWIEVFFSSDFTPNAGLGTSVSLDGDVAAAGAPGDYDASWMPREPSGLVDAAKAIGGVGPSKAIGSVRILNRGPDGNWFRVAMLAGDGPGGGRFGCAVAISQRYLLVGASEADGLSSQSGAVFVFERKSSGKWARVGKLAAADGAPGDGFGSSLSLSGERALVGARKADGAGQDVGRAYVFERQSSGTWAQIAELTAPDAASGDSFGCAVALSAEHAFVGAESDDDLGGDSGAAYVIGVP